MIPAQVKNLPNPWALLATSLLLALSFPPFDLVFPPFVGLIPLFLFVESADDAKQAVVGGLLVGILTWTSLLYWVTLFLFHQTSLFLSVLGFVAMIFYLTSYMVLFVLGLWILRRGAILPFWLIAPPLWVALEHIRGSGELAFTWNQLSYSLSYHPLPLQTADLVGSYGVSFWIVLVNALLYEVAGRRGRRRALTGTALLIVLVIPLVYGVRCLGRKDLVEGEAMTISLIQPNIDQDRKYSPAYRDTVMSILEDLSREALDADPDLVVWPETAVPAYVRHDMIARNWVSGLASTSGVPFLVGAQDYERVAESGYRTYNSAFLFHADGRMEEERYSKIRLVPFGEKTPFEGRFPSLRAVSLGGGHFSPGDSYTLFPVGAGRFGVLICFESIFPELSRGFCRAGADFLLNITNDAWFLRTSAPYQHAAALPLRAIENRVYIGRSANTGISMIVDPLGRITGSTPIFTKAVLSGEIRTRNMDTFYRRHGDGVVDLSWALLLLGFLYLSFRKRRGA